MSSFRQTLQPPKQIRFVNNPGQPPSKRRRINAACLTCRKRKTRCAGERPACSTCTDNGHHCLGYVILVERRKEPTSGALPGTAKRSCATTLCEAETETAFEGEHSDLQDDHEESNNDLDDDAAYGKTFDNGAAPQRRASETARRSGDGNKVRSPEGRRRASGNDLLHEQPRHTQPHEWEMRRRSSQKHGQVAQPFGAHENTSTRQENHRRSVSIQGSSHGGFGSHSDHGSSSRPSSGQQDPHHHHNESHRVPYFRYFGPTAIVPGYKRMVVDLSPRDHHHDCGRSFHSSSPNACPTETNLGQFQGQQSQQSQQGQQRQGNFKTSLGLPAYDPSDQSEVHPLIINLISIFFSHLGCNYPFLKEQCVIQKLRDKRMEPILVDAMCALAARFSDLSISSNENDEGRDGGCRTMTHSDIGNFYAQRARAATVNTFPCPSVAAVQACLLMAYEGFGADQDSTLWMYLGISIRMAVDLGLQKKISVDTAQGDENPWFMQSWNGIGAGDNQARGAKNGNMSPISLSIQQQHGGSHDGTPESQDLDMAIDGGNKWRNEITGAEETRDEEQERADTFWAVFFLDRVISSGTGRPVTLKDDDFDLDFPSSVLDPVTKQPAPFPVLAQVIHLYGRVSDVLNNIRNVYDLTQEKMKFLGQMESDLTRLYQRQDPRLNFNVPNFQAYVRAGNGTTFILLHFWFHAVIIILHQPTLLTPFGSLHRRHQLRPNSHELSMSSAKTIADILAFAELIDPKSFVGNPFTSQPMYIAACAFLAESVANSSLPASRNASPPPHFHSDEQDKGHRGESLSDSAGVSGSAGARAAARHSLLASNANQNYQRCYKSLQQLHLYWGGVRYILSALDQKAKGIWDCETFTVEELDSRSLGHIPGFDSPCSPNAPPIAWSLTGTSNSANPSLTVLFQSHARAFPNARPSGHSRLAHTHKHQKKRTIQHEQEQHRQKNTPQADQVPGFTTADPGSIMSFDSIWQSSPEELSTFPTTVFPQANISAVRSCPQTNTRREAPQQQQQQGQLRYQQHSAAYSSNLRQAQTQEAYRHDEGHYGVLDETSPDIALDGQQAGLFDTDAAYHEQYYRRHGMPTSHLGSSSSHAPPQPPRPTGLGHGESSRGGDDAGDAGNAGDAADFYNCLDLGPSANVITFDSQEVDISQVPLLTDIMPQWLEYLPSNVLSLFDGRVSDTNL